MRILITGGSGFVGTHLRQVHPQWQYVSSRTYNLMSLRECHHMIEDLRPTAIVHLAARVGGIKDNKDRPGSYFYENTAINNNVLECARAHGVSRVLSCLSTCAFPDVVDNYPFTEEDLHQGPPTKTNLSYGYTKRMLQVQSEAYRQQYGLNYSTFCPSNIYGPGDHFGKQSSHFVAALVTKIANAQDGETIQLWGTGTPLRQQLYVKDLCQIIPILLEKHNSSAPLIVAHHENLSIKSMAEELCSQIDKNINICFDNDEQMDGQYRKDGDNSKLKKLIPDFEFTSFKKGILQTYNWYAENR